MGIRFFLNSILLGAGLAMDAFSVSCANALREPEMRPARMSFIAGVYGMFQFLMPLTGWICVHTIQEHLVTFQRFIPWIALVLLVWIGGMMLLEGIHGLKASSRADAQDRPKERSARGEDLSGQPAAPVLTVPVLLVQGIATSIDALSVGFAIADYTLHTAVLSCLIIGVVTFVICMGGLAIGRKAGTMLTGKADILGGVILIAIGILNLIR